MKYLVEKVWLHIYMHRFTKYEDLHMYVYNTWRRVVHILDVGFTYLLCVDMKHLREDRHLKPKAKGKDQTVIRGAKHSSYNSSTLTFFLAFFLRDGSSINLFITQDLPKMGCSVVDATHLYGDSSKVWKEKKPLFYTAWASYHVAYIRPPWLAQPQEYPIMARNVWVYPILSFLPQQPKKT